jgi:phosphatidylserine/phosphatidylglycerophosphate/cardiolipin synthase-like enzyme
MLPGMAKQLLEALSVRSSVAAHLFEAIQRLKAGQLIDAPSLLRTAKLTLTEQRGAEEVMAELVRHDLAEATSFGWRISERLSSSAKMLTVAFEAVDHYRSAIHKDRTEARLVLTRPPHALGLDQALSNATWSLSNMAETDASFRALAQRARRRFVVMTPFLDDRGADWLQSLLEETAPGVERTVILRYLDRPGAAGYPVGITRIRSWLDDNGVRVSNYFLPTQGTEFRETFHAKVVLSDSDAAYVGSANVTGASQAVSMELGILVTGQAALDVAAVVDAILKCCSA